MILKNNSEKSEDKIFENYNTEHKKEDENKSKTNQQFFSTGPMNLIDKIFDRVERICIILWSDYLNEEEAAIFFRLKDSKNSGKNTIRNYALRSKKVSFAKIGRFGLLFHKKDLDKLYQQLKAESYRDL